MMAAPSSYAWGLHAVPPSDRKSTFALLFLQHLSQCPSKLVILAGGYCCGTCVCCHWKQVEGHGHCSGLGMPI